MSKHSIRSLIKSFGKKQVLSRPTRPPANAALVLPSLAMTKCQPEEETIEGKAVYATDPMEVVQAVLSIIQQHRNRRWNGPYIVYVPQEVDLDVLYPARHIQLGERLLEIEGVEQVVKHGLNIINVKALSVEPFYGSI